MNRQAVAGSHAESAPLINGGILQRKCACGQHTDRGECEGCRKKKQSLQRRKGSLSEPDRVPPIVQDVLRSPGQPLDAATRAFMEPRFGQDFSGVRVHSNAEAAESARAVNALAYTVGRDVVFGRGLYAPETGAGRRLLAHELTHVVQQRSATYPAEGLSVADGSWEQEAELAASAVMAGQPARVTQRASDPQLVRQQVHRESEELHEQGREVRVERVVTSGMCRQRPETRTRVRSEITITQAGIEISYCRGRTQADVSGTLDYSDVVKRALGAVPSVLSGDSGAFEDLRQSLQQAEPSAEIHVRLRQGDVEVGLRATGLASLEGGTSGELELSASGRIGSTEVGGSVTVSGGTEEEASVMGTLTITPGATGSDAPDCFRCACSDYTVDYHCTERQTGQEEPPRSQRPTLYVPLFFEYADVIPRRGWEQTYQDMLSLVLRHIRDGYTIARIEGRTSPEGPLQRQEIHGFEGNLSLARRRAQEAQRDLEAALDQEIARESGRHAVLRMRVEEPDVLRRLREARAAGYQVEGHAPAAGPATAEFFGSTGSREVARRSLPAHLRTELQRPAAGQPDPLALEHVIGEGVPAGVRADVEADVEAFRSVGQGELQDLELVYRPFRRALIVLNPPTVVIPSPREVGRSTADDMGAYTPCLPEHERLFATRPIPGEWLLEGECRPGARRRRGGR